MKSHEIVWHESLRTRLELDETGASLYVTTWTSGSVSILAWNRDRIFPLGMIG